MTENTVKLNIVTSCLFMIKWNQAVSYATKVDSRIENLGFIPTLLDDSNRWYACVSGGMTIDETNPADVIESCHVQATELVESLDETTELLSDLADTMEELAQTYEQMG
jgi:hypothetical protein